MTKLESFLEKALPPSISGKSVTMPTHRLPRSFAASRPASAVVLFRQSTTTAEFFPARRAVRKKVPTPTNTALTMGFRTAGI